MRVLECSKMVDSSQYVRVLQLAVDGRNKKTENIAAEVNPVVGNLGLLIAARWR